MEVSHFVSPSLPYLPSLYLRKLGWWICGTPMVKGLVGPPRFSRAFNDWELDYVECFLQKIQTTRVYRDVDDKVIWTTSRCGNFSVRSLYSILEPEDSLVFPSSIIWGSCVPPMVAFFVWGAT